MGRKKQKKRLKRLMKALRDGGASPVGESTMNTDPFLPASNADPSSGTAAIPPVTDAMMDHAAHRAAELVEAAAHGGVVSGDAAPHAPDIAAQAAPEMAEPSAETPSAAPEPTPVEVAGEAVAPAAEAFDGTAARAVPSGGEVAAAARDAVSRTAGASQAALSGSADAFGRYNAKLFEVMRANMAATGSHVAALLQAKSVPEAVTLNADHLRRQLDTMTLQGRELATLAQTLTFGMLAPLRGLIAPDR